MLEPNYRREIRLKCVQTDEMVGEYLTKSLPPKIFGEPGKQENDFEHKETLSDAGEGGDCMSSLSWSM